jgi:hypothetical protein
MKHLFTWRNLKQAHPHFNKALKRTLPQKANSIRALCITNTSERPCNSCWQKQQQNVIHMNEIQNKHNTHLHYAHPGTVLHMKKSKTSTFTLQQGTALKHKQYKHEQTLTRLTQQRRPLYLYELYG